ncbi:unnamed protein product, partial [Adineta steineri]
MIHDQSSQTTYCIFECSADCYDEVMVTNIGRYFQNLLLHIFTENTKTIGFDPFLEKIGNLSLLPMNVETLSSVIESLRYFSEINAVIEQHMPMIGASMFWHDALHDCKLDHSLSLPYDRYRLSHEHRTGRGTSISFDFDQDLCDTFIHYTSSQSISLEHLALSMYFVFLFKLTNGETDLCIGMNVDGRYRDELISVIGMFVNTIPLRCQLDPQWFLHKLVKHVQEILTNSRKYSYFPLQRILDQHLNTSKPAFLDTSFKFIRYSPQDLGKDVIIGDSHLSVMPISIKISEGDIMSKFDFILSIRHDFDMNQLSCIISASLDLFNQETVKKISQRFHLILNQLSASMIDSQINKPIYELSLILSNEQYLMQSLNNTQTSFSSPHTCIHHEFVYQVMKHPQKLAVELDEQSLTYSELLYYVQILSLALLNEYQVFPGEVVCQCVERSLSMIIGILSIEIIGDVYCPLSPENPEQRLQNLVEQTKARLILVHSLTSRIFKNNFITYDIDTMINCNDKITNDDLYRLSNISITPDNISYIVFTSGSTGIPKAVQVRHRNLTAYMKSFAEITTLKRSDNVIQMASCSFDNHFQETLGALMIGAGLIMLHPHGNKDLTYLIRELMDKDVTFLDAVPSYLDTLCQHLEIQNANECLKKLRILCSGGDVLTNQIMLRLKNYASVPSSSSSDGCQLWNMYGQAEVTITTTYFQIGFDFDCDKEVMSIGKPLPNYHCVNMDEYFQLSAINQEGELCVGGASVFAGYLGRNDLTAKALVEIDGEIFYRTGDLVRMENNGLLHYQGRKDHQIKLHGQRIELGEIERCLLDITSISACIVMKWNDDYLVAYIQSSHVNEEQLRQHYELSRYEPFPVTDIQLAYLVGREGAIELGHVSTFAYNEYDFSSSFNIGYLERALNYLIQRHEALRIIFPSHTKQIILKTVPYYIISTLNLDNVQSPQKFLIERREQLSHQVRPADQWPLFDFQITRFISDDDHKIRLHCGFDLLILDFWSMNLVLHELNQLYCNSNDVLVELKLSYRDYILAQRQWKNTTIYRSDRQYWINRLKSFPLGPNLPLQCLPNEIHVQRHCNVATILDLPLCQKLRKRITDHGLTPAGFLASIYALVLGKWSENKHFALNLPVFNRLSIHPQVNQIAGDFTTVIPLEINLDKIITYYEFIHTVQKQLWNDLEHMSYDGVSFIRDLMQVHQTRDILLPYVFTCGVDVEGIREKNVEHNIFFDQVPVYAISQTPQIFIDHIVEEINDCLSINWTYVDNLFRKEMINHIHDTYIDLLVKLASFDDTWQQSIFISLPSEQQKRRLDFNQTQCESNIKDKLLHSLVIKQAESTPNALAIVSSQVNLTYRQLMSRVYSLAYHLQQQQTYTNQLIAILMKKGWEQVVACLAILVLGGAYLPLDIDSPYDRLCSLLEETNIAILLTQSHCKHVFPHLTTIPVGTFAIDDNYPTPFPIKKQLSTDLAYVIYTSGSTGKPKGVMISHQAVVNTILDINSRLDISTNDRIFALSHLNFDLSVYDIFGILIGGGTIVIPNHEDYKNPQHWYDMIIQHHVTIWNSVPMLMQMFVEHLKHTNNNHNKLRHILLSGDWIPLSLPESIQITFGEQVTITSLGGATEASIWSIAYTLPKEIPQEWKSIPYGIPLRNQQYYVYDIHLDDCPEWVIGELYIGGEGLANGYWNDQEKTQSNFIIHPLTNERLYRTGDYGRFLPTGYIEFTGRKDFQVKVHGHRIELGEIEHHLQQHLDIQQAIVNLDDKSQQLIGYVMPEKHSIHNEEYDSAEILITGPIERINFKLARHSIRQQKKIEKSFALTKSKLTETLINTYYMRKSYRQFTNETIERSTIENLLKHCHNSNNNERISLSHLDSDILSQLLAVLTPISISDQPLPKYRYASIDDLYPIQVYVELPRSIDNISPGVYYHNPDEHTLELISTHINNEIMNIRLHLVGRSSAIAPLYGKRLGSQFCMLEAGYVIGLLEKEGSRLGLTFSKNTHNEPITREIVNIDESDTHCCFEISSFEQHISSNVQNGNHQCIIYLKSTNNNKDQWLTYHEGNDTVTSFDVQTETTQEEIPLFFDDDDDAKIIFHDCQCAIFFVGRSEYTMNIGKISHLLMDHCLEMNIGMCPVGTRTSFPKKFNDVLDTILIHEELNGSNILHTLLIGKISNKQKYERSISKVKPMPNWSETLRIHLKKKLPMYMVPSHFISVSSFPLSPNGKIDRKALPEISLSVLQQEDTYNAPNTELETIIANIWQEILYTDRLIIQHDNLESNKLPSIANVYGMDRQISFLISTTASFFSVGGNSLLLIEIYQHYQSKFIFEREALSIRFLFDYNTIVEHAKLLETIIIDGVQLKQWHTLNINEGIASYAQERIFLDERVRFSNQIAIYNESIILRVTKGSLSVNRLLQALRYVLSKHKILRTSLVFNDKDSILKQSITDKHLTFTLDADQTFQNENELKNIIHQMTISPKTFDLSIGRVFYCQILRQQMMPDENHDKEIIKNSDVLVFGFHHVAIDHSTFPIFFNDLCNTYNSNMTWLDDEESLQYIDYSVHERLIDMTLSHDFWRSQLNGYNQECGLSLPVDRHCLYSDQKFECSSIAYISFDNKISTSFLNYASSHQVTPFQLGLATFYAFLFKLTYRQNDLCVSCLSANRYRVELQNIAGMFVSTLPYRTQLNPQWSFDELVKYVQEKCLSILEHSHYPLQHILRDSHLNQSTVHFLQTSLDFITVTSVDNQFTFDDVSLQPVSLEQFSEMAKFDFKLSFTCSRDLFEDTTVTKMIQRFQYLFEQLFSTNFNVDQGDLIVSPITKLTLILPNEVNEMQHVDFYRQSNVTNEALSSLTLLLDSFFYGQICFSPASFGQTRIWLDERVRFDPDKPQVAIYNMPFVYRLQPDHTLSVKQLRHALYLTVNKHPSLHTSLHFDIEKNLLMQQVITHEHKNDNNNNMFSIIETTYETDEQLNEILHDEKRNPHLFDLAQGLVFRCHIIYYKQISPDDLLSHKDLLIFNFHHALFDFPSMNIFLHDLNQAYTTGQLLYDDSTNLRYLDYAVIEQQMSMSGASMFWLDTLHDCQLDQSLPLPYDRYRLANEHRTDRGTSISFNIGQDLSHHFLRHASANNISLEYLALTTYYVLLFKLTDGEKDLCIGINTHGRYRDELNSVIGMFVNAIPLRCQLDPHLSFHELTKHVQDSMINSMKYSYFPLQRILNQHPNISNPVFLDTSFEFILSMAKDEEDEIMVGDTRFSLLPFSIKISEDEVMSKFDFILSFQHDLNLNEFSCTINASLDLFKVETVCVIAQRLQTMLHQQFTSFDCITDRSIYELSLKLSNEQYLMQSLNNTQVSFLSPLTCIHHEFVYQVMKHPQKVAVELDEQSLTYCELLYYVQVLSLTLVNEYHVLLGEIICQCVERSLSMVIGILSIAMVGSAYCPLSLRDPPQRLQTLVNQTQSRLVLVHASTPAVFSRDNLTLNIDCVIHLEQRFSDVNLNKLSNVTVTPESVVFVIFTSGSTGIPKAVQLCHRNFAEFMHSFVNIDVVTNKRASAVKWLRSLCSGGEAVNINQVNLFQSLVREQCRIRNHYGPAEITINCACYLIAPNKSQTSISIGQLLPNYQCLILNEFSQFVCIGHEGELLVGGVGIFAGYFNRDDLTTKAMININGEMYYKTGDLVRLDTYGLLHYQGRKDHQIKLHGQRIELGEIERCLLNTTSISACVVMKSKDDNLVAYVQSSHINEEQLREHCQFHLPPHIIPSLFIILDKLPLNPNGKIDRKLLPPPHFSSVHLTNSTELLLPTNDIEVNIRQIWCELFKLNQISIDTNIFTIGGHSLLMMQLFHRYKIEFHLETNTLSISHLFQHPTIIHHAQLIHQSINTIHTLDDDPWSSLHLIQARASFAQERIYLDEQIRFSSNKTRMNNMYVIPLLYRISSINDHISITRLFHAFQSVITKHNILRTALYMDANGHIIQHCLDMKSDGLTIVNIHNDDRHHMNEIIDKILNQADLFDLSKGRVIRCHILHHYRDNNSCKNNNLMSENEHILISIHHAMFDGASTSIFIRDLSLAYQSHDSLS